MANKPITAAELLSDTPPEGPPLHNPLSAEAIQAYTNVIQNGHVITDLIQRAHHIGLDMQAPGQHEMHQAIAHRMSQLLPGPKVQHLEE